MKVLITCVCYNNFLDAYKYICSLVTSLQKAPSIELVDLYLVNNGNEFTNSQLLNLKDISSSLLKVNVIKNQINDGYFPGCHKGYLQSLTTGVNYDAMLITNVDLEVQTDFLHQLSLLNSNYGTNSVIIAPSIISLSENKDRNPKVKTRFSKKQMQKYMFLYFIPYLHSFYKKTLYKSKRSCEKLAPGSSIYAPHGSFIVVMGGVKFWDDLLRYPVFLFGEEIYIGEQARLHNIPVNFHSELKVIDSDHASTGKENEHFIRHNNSIAINYLYNRYWK
ncbi:hypothetical protein [Shewanella sp. WPAGA9]|uniref:hypothetical protein n=1 Tax=Shewanella sp. ENK2 TaxID=2775245 RepID=UPI001786A7DF|nr:hypothetical protein [Shewanella sp. WPAGA9]